MSRSSAFTPAIADRTTISRAVSITSTESWPSFWANQEASVKSFWMCSRSGDIDNSILPVFFLLRQRFHLSRNRPKQFEDLFDHLANGFACDHHVRAFGFSRENGDRVVPEED